MMLRFAGESGLELTPELIHDIAELDSVLEQLNLEPVSALPEVLLRKSAASAPRVGGGDATSAEPVRPSAPAAPGGAQGVAPNTPGPDAVGRVKAVEVSGRAPSSAELVLRVHGALSRVVAPATALTLQATEPPPGKNTIFGTMPIVVKLAAAVALVSAVGFVISAGIIGKKAAAERELEKAKATQQDKTTRAEDATRAKDEADQGEKGAVISAGQPKAEGKKREESEAAAQQRAAGTHSQIGGGKGGGTKP
jgi:hypothetical protein